jgi:hypothetical protein
MNSLSGITKTFILDLIIHSWLSSTVTQHRHDEISPTIAPKAATQPSPTSINRKKF